jgi:hypothetical protein
MTFGRADGRRYEASASGSGYAWTARREPAFARAKEGESRRSFPQGSGGGAGAGSTPAVHFAVVGVTVTVRVGVE